MLGGRTLQISSEGWGGLGQTIWLTLEDHGKIRRDIKISIMIYIHTYIYIMFIYIYIYMICICINKYGYISGFPKIGYPQSSKIRLLWYSNPWYGGFLSHGGTPLSLDGVFHEQYIHIIYILYYISNPPYSVNWDGKDIVESTISADSGWWLSLALWKIWARQLGLWHSQLI